VSELHLARDAVLAALRKKGTIQGAARELHISTDTLYDAIHRYKIVQWREFVTDRKPVRIYDHTLSPRRKRRSDQTVHYVELWFRRKIIKLIKDRYGLPS
jgi:hypothetical protein